MKNKVFVFNKTGNSYLVIEEGEMKDPSTREWLKSVVYKSLETGNIYTRELNDFLNKFSIKND